MSGLAEANEIFSMNNLVESNKANKLFTKQYLFYLQNLKNKSTKLICCVFYLNRKKVSLFLKCSCQEKYTSTILVISTKRFVCSN